MSRRTSALALSLVALLSSPAGVVLGDETDAPAPLAAVDRVIVLADADGTTPEAGHHGHHGHGEDGWIDVASHHTRPDAYAPVGVMGDHVHHAGEWMLSYRYMYMEMDGNRDGTDDVGVAEVLRDYMVAPTRMTMEMHMLGVMYAATEDLTLMVMVPWLALEMEHRTRMGREFTTRAEGLGDVRVTGLYALWRGDRQQIHLNAGISLPSGSIDEEDDTPAGPDQQLPYPMQLGSGTVDLLPGLTYTGETDDWSWGAQAAATLRLGRNDRGYSLGDRAYATAWGARRWTGWASTAVRANFEGWGDIDGDDDRLNPMMVPTADPDRRAGERLDLLVGMNLVVPQSGGWLADHRFAVEVGAPVYQRLDGPQLEMDWVLTLGWRKAF